MHWLYLVWARIITAWLKDEDTGSFIVRLWHSWEGVFRPEWILGGLGEEAENAFLGRWTNETATCLYSMKTQRIFDSRVHLMGKLLRVFPTSSGSGYWVHCPVFILIRQPELLNGECWPSSNNYKQLLHFSFSSVFGMVMSYSQLSFIKVSTSELLREG